MGDNRASAPRRGADIVVEALEDAGVARVFGVPGAKIDAVFDALVDRGPSIVVCRHEQNAAFMAAATGRITGIPGVCIATSGPGAANLVTGLATATAEGDPVVALAGGVPRADQLKRTHQSLRTAELFEPVTKHSAEVEHEDDLAEAMVNAFRTASAPRRGAVALTLPQDVQASPTRVTVRPGGPVLFGAAPPEAVEEAARTLDAAQRPVVLLGLRAGVPGLPRLLEHGLPVVETFQASGLAGHNAAPHLYGRVGLWRNQPGDELLARADVILAVGFDGIEYDPELWNVGSAALIHLDVVPADLGAAYQPALELLGDVGATLAALAERLRGAPRGHDDDLRSRAHALFAAETAARGGDGRAHPLRVIAALRRLAGPDVTFACDTGSHAIWMARHFRVDDPGRLLFSNGQQTLGVGLPWALAAALARPGEKAVSVSGDGGFLFSATELETAVRLAAATVHLVWRDGAYNMVAFQQQMKYGRTSGVDFGEPDLVRFAESFGATGLRVGGDDELDAVLARAFAADGPVVVDIPIDYSDNTSLAADIHADAFH